MAAFVLRAETAARFPRGVDASLNSSPAFSFCRIAPNASEPAFYTEMAEVNARMHAAMEIAPSGNADRDFVQMMIAHHQGAIDMALVLLKYSRDERLRRLAQSIIVEQGQEIAYMHTLQNPPLNNTPVTNRIANQ